MATGRSDYPNQVNNVLGFPFIFRGALDVRSTQINEAMKLAAVQALADLAKTAVPDIVNMAYNEKTIVFGPQYIIPKPLDPRLLSTVAPAVAIGFAALLMSGDLVQFAQWAVGRTDRNYQASLALGRILPPGTMVQGKLANGLSLENRIRPIFIGHGFGNFADRFQREDVRYILTYTAPEIGYEGSQIEDVLAAYPGWRVIMTFDVAETPGGHDTAALIEKRARH